MNNTRWPYWVKGALLFGLIFVPMFWAGAIGWLFPVLGIIWVIMGSPLVGRFAFLLVGGDVPGSLGSTQRFWQTCIIVSFYILIGALIGLFYGKIKARNHASRR